MNKSKIVLSTIICLAVAITLAATFLIPIISNLSPSHVYHVEDVVTDHWQFVGYMFGGSTSSGLSEYATFNNRQGENEEMWGVVEFDVWANGTLTLGNHTYICTSYFGPRSWYGPDPSTITLVELGKK